MSSIKSTPGPWTYTDHPEAGFVNPATGNTWGSRIVHEIIKLNINETVCVAVLPMSHLTDLANARLIAAAPDLLDACKDAHAYLNIFSGDIARGICKKLKAAITKAESDDAKPES